MNFQNNKLLQELENRPDITRLDSLTRKYLQAYPPTLAHGYSHLKKTARFSFQLAVDNQYQSPELAYLGGLLHDLYRPARGEAGLERHGETTAKRAEKILNKTPFANKKKEILTAILNPDEAIRKGGSTPLMEIVSIADDSDMSFQRAVAYSWASNKYQKKNNKIAYTNFRETMRDFCIYQIKGWEVFLSVRIRGARWAIEAYMKTHEDLIQAVRDELDEKITYRDKAIELASKEARQDEEFLRKVGAGKEEIRKIATNYLELIK